MIDRFLSKTGVGIALLFMIAELSYVNTLSLKYMYGSNAVYSVFFGIVGAIAFSSVTVLVMRLGKRRWLKLAFPVFDTLLMFCGFNLYVADHLFDNPIRFAMSIFLSLFSGLITYSLGQINAEIHQVTQTDIEKLQSDLEVTQKSLLQLQAEKSQLEAYFFKHEKSRILKKREHNRTPEEIIILTKTEQ